MLRLFRSKREQEQRYAYMTTHTVVTDFAEFSSIPIGEIADRIARHFEISAADWHTRGDFYETSQSYIFDTLSANLNADQLVAKLNRFNPAIVQIIREKSGRFLDFGGGVGLTCEAAARAGHEVTYLDVASIVFNFAQWRFKKYGLNINCVAAIPGKISIPGRFDIVFTDAVIEHFPTALQIEATEALARATDDYLIYLVDLSGPTPQQPMHYHVNIRDLHQRIEAQGLRCNSGFNTFCSIWRR